MRTIALLLLIVLSGCASPARIIAQDIVTIANGHTVTQHHWLVHPGHRAVHN